MNKNIKRASLSAVAFTMILSGYTTPVLAKNYINSGDNSFDKNPFDTTSMSFSTRNKDRREWYNKFGSPLVYKTYKNGVYFYSPVRPRDVKTGLSNYSGLYENYYTKKAGNVGAWTTSGLLASRSNHNFKTKAKSIASVKKGTAGGFVPSVNMDTTGEFPGKYGEWRYLGYSSDAASTGNALFPEDYGYGYHPHKHPYVTKPWQNSKLPNFVPGTTFDTARPITQSQIDKASAREKDSLIAEKKRFDTKYNLVKKLLAQNPTMTKYNGKSYSIGYWMDRLSLTAPALHDTGVFRGIWNVGTTRNPVYRYMEYAVINEVEQRNLMITRMEVIEKSSGDIVGVYTNNSPGKKTGSVSYRGEKVLYTQTKYDLKVTVKNLNNVATKVPQSVVESGYKKNYNPTTAYPSNFRGTNGNEYLKAVKGGKIAAKGSMNFYLRDIIIPDDQADRSIMLTGLIGAEHRKQQDNLNTDDDAAILPIAVKAKPGDMQMEKIELIDESGKVVPQPIPGEKYRVRYTYQYNGGDIREARYYTATDKDGNKYPVFDYWYYPMVDLSVKSNIERKLPRGSSDFSQETIRIRSQVSNGDKFQFTTKEAVLYENPYVKATGDFEISDSYQRYNSGTDIHTKLWERPYDYGVENLQVVPRTERTATGGKMKVAVSFTLTQDAPSEAIKKNFQEDIDFSVTLDGKTKTFTEHLVEGKNKNVVVEMEADVKPHDWMAATVNINDTGDAWEFSKTENVKANNSASTLQNLSLISLPKGDNYGNNNTSGYVSGYMLTPGDDEWVSNTENTWTQEYRVTDFKGVRVPYQSKSGNDYVFTKYTQKPVATTEKVEQEESYKIQRVLFRSKYTKDNREQVGADANGWVDMLTASKLPRIKAGYGYELKVEVAYKTNAFSTQPGKVDIPNFANRLSRTGTGTSVRPYHVEPNIPQDIFVKVPGMDKAMSVTGANGTVPKLVLDTRASKLDNVEDQLFVYTMQVSNDMGVEEPGKVYVGENVKDGEYQINVWTPQINGIPTKNLIDVNGLSVYEPSLLGDNHELRFEVKGSATDDLVDTIIQ
ncbi:hypothetical protein JMA_41620 (plasmid) [Jeotgalibacillus malaysiensis]|uniref:DUF5704 domain-containing protein n=1 Tax=Jeotgalibacillus malaysiensis TaxID=1508404 RepID=A0A0B5AZV9_9BACL|nr:hypothetical protein [Jeotgalibacillus malaysiensis]AJD93479.1 hypothetical protein JMA_41620 [Jeotgalibacillus malaysiensis]